MGHYPRFKIILALAEHRGNDKKIIDKIKEISGAVAGLSDERNRYVHDAWFLQIVSEKVSAVGQFKSLSIKSKKVGLTDRRPGRPCPQNRQCRLNENVRAFAGMGAFTF